MDDISIELVGGALDGTAFTAVEDQGQRTFKEWAQETATPGSDGSSTLIPELFKDTGPPFHVMCSNTDGNRLTFLVGELNSHWWQVLQYDYKEVRCQDTVEGASWSNVHLYRYTKIYAQSDGKRTTGQAAKHMRS